MINIIIHLTRSCSKIFSMTHPKKELDTPGVVISGSPSVFTEPFSIKNHGKSCHYNPPFALRDFRSNDQIKSIFDKRHDSKTAINVSPLKQKNR